MNEKTKTTVRRKLTQTKSRLISLFKTRSVRRSLTIIFIGLFVFFYLSNPHVFRELGNYNMLIISLSIIFPLLNIATNSLFLKISIDKLADKISYKDSFYTTYLSTFANYFLPMRSGSAVRAIYLKNKYNFKYKDFISTLYGNYIVVILTSSALALIALYLIYISQNIYSLSFSLAMLALFIMSLSLVSAKFRLDDLVLKILDSSKIKPLIFLSEKIKSLLSGWKALITNRGLRWKIVLIALSNLVTRIVFFYVLLNQASPGIGFTQVLIFSIITTLSIFIGITPGALGVREALLILYANVIMLDNATILSVSLVERALTFIVIIGLFLFFKVFKPDASKDATPDKSLNI